MKNFLQLGRREEAERVTPAPWGNTRLRACALGSLRLVHRQAADVDHHVPILEEAKGVQMDFMPHVILERLEDFGSVSLSMLEKLWYPVSRQPKFPQVQG